MKKAVWLTGVFVIVFALLVGCYMLFFQEKSSKVPEGTFVKMETTEMICSEVEDALIRPENINFQNHFLILRQNARTRTEGMWGAWQQSA